MGNLERNLGPQAVEWFEEQSKREDLPPYMRFKFELLLLCNKYDSRDNDITTVEFYGVLQENIMGIHYQDMEDAKEQIGKAMQRYLEK